MPAVPTLSLIDPGEAAREEARRLLAVSGLAVVAHGGYGPEAPCLLRQATPSLVVMAMRGIPQRALIMREQVRAIALGTPLSVYGLPSAAAEVTALGARACLPDRPGEALLEAIHRVLAVEEALRRRAGDAAPGGTTLAIVSARGGVGKTTVAAGLAAAFAAHLGLSAVLVDCDPYGGVAGLLPQERGAPLALPPSSLEEAPQLEARHDFVVVDTAAGLREEALRALELCDLALLVTTPEVGVLREHARALAQLADWGFPPDRLLLVLDRTHPSHRAPAAAVAQALDRQVAGDIPYDRRLRRLAEEGITPVLAAASSPAARALIGLAARLAGLDSSSRHRPLLGRLLPLPGRSLAAFLLAPPLPNVPPGAAPWHRQVALGEAAPNDGKPRGMPLPGIITSRFGRPAPALRPGPHSGVDIAASPGTPVHTTAPGRVLTADYDRGSVALHLHYEMQLPDRPIDPKPYRAPEGS